MKEPRALYHMERVRVICPDCGQGGANRGPCYCHNCDYQVMMLPCDNTKTYNWVEHERYTS